MKSRQPILGSLLWITVLFLLGALITISAFMLLVPPERRGTGFFLALTAICAAEFVGFAWTANYFLSLRSDFRVSGATQILIHLLIVGWFVITVLFSLVMAPASSAQGDPSWTRWVIVIYVALTFLYFVAAIALYSRDATLQAVDRLTQGERQELQVRVGDVDRAVLAIRNWAKQAPDQSAAADRLVKRLDGIRTGLQYAPPAKAGAMEESGPRSVQAVNAQIGKQLEELGACVAGFGGSADAASRSAGAVGGILDQIDSLLEQRQQLLLS